MDNLIGFFKPGRKYESTLHKYSSDGLLHDPIERTKRCISVWPMVPMVEFDTGVLYLPPNRETCVSRAMMTEDGTLTLFEIPEGGSERLLLTYKPVAPKLEIVL